VGELIKVVQHAILPPFMGAVLHEVVRPDVISAFSPQAGARAIALPDTAALGLSGWDLQPFLPPDTFHTLVVDHPARRAPQQSCNLPVAQPTLFPALRDLALGRPVLTERRSGATLGDRQNLPDVGDTGPAPRRA
jgi:hypothetical protein